MNKHSAQQMFDNLFTGKKAVLDYFQATGYEDYEIDQINEIWDFVGGCNCMPSLCKPDKVVWGPGEIDGRPIPLSEHDCGYSHPVKRVFSTEDFTLVLLSSNYDDRAIIFDNSLRYRKA